MAAPNAEGTSLVLTPAGGGTAITVGCIEQIRLIREARTTTPDVITSTSGASAWSGEIVTGKSMSIDVSGYAKGGGAADTITVGGVYTAELRFGSDMEIDLTGLTFVCTQNQIEASGSGGIKYNLKFTINMASIC